MSAIFACREAVRLANQSLDHPLTLIQRIELRTHLAMCQACRVYRRQSRALSRTIAGGARAGLLVPVTVELSPAARGRIAQALRQRPTAGDQKDV